MMIGTSRVSWSLRQRRARSRPLVPGSIQSSRIRSGTRSAMAACASRASPACTGSYSPLRRAKETMSRIAGSSSTMRMRFCTRSPGERTGGGLEAAPVHYRFVTGPLHGTACHMWGPRWRSLVPQVLVADALPLEFQHGGGDGGDARLDPGPCVIVEVGALLERIQLD